VFAILEAGKKAKGGTLYVSLEPCCTFGRTPPCTDLIIRGGLKRVVIGTCDPNPKHHCNGVSILRKHGIEVITGIMEKEARQLIAPFAKWIKHKLPFLIIKLAITCDGKIADFKGNSKWITGKLARADVHNLRRTCDAIIIGAGTAIADNPSLLPAPLLNRKPYRVVVDASGRVPATLKLFNDNFASHTIIATTSKSPKQRIKEWEKKGAKILFLKSYSYNKKNRVDLKELLSELAKMNVLKALCEGGGELASSFVREKLTDALKLYIAPKILGESPFSAFRNISWELCKAPGFILQEEKKFGDDLLLSFNMP
jgi:diaminohydroxyphosphoribosylaminopyrimidine deaminase/5-amino-6-(5-phosphoribosylamino)uracil reductase